VAHPNDLGRPAHVLPGGESLDLDGSTVTDPETGRPVPAAVLRLPAWRLQEVAAALHVWSRMQTLFITEGAHLPTETALATSLAAAGETIGGDNHRL
jgi:hypothetical protein